MKKLSSIGLYASVFVAFFLFPKYYAQVPNLQSVNEIIKYPLLVFSVIDFLVIFVFGKKFEGIEKPKF